MAGRPYYLNHSFAGIDCFCIGNGHGPCKNGFTPDFRAHNGYFYGITAIQLAINNKSSSLTTEQTFGTIAKTTRFFS